MTGCESLFSFLPRAIKRVTKYLGGMFAVPESRLTWLREAGCATAYSRPSGFDSRLPPKEVLQVAAVAMRALRDAL